MFLEDADYQNASDLLNEIVPVASAEIKAELYDRACSAYDQADFKGCLVLGEALILHDKSEPKLLNKMGNCLRRLKSQKEANQYYKKSLQRNKNYSIAFYNLAASLANIDRFDDEILKLLRHVERFNDFIIPDYISIKSIKARRRIVEIVFDRRQDRENDRIQELLLEKDLKFQMGHLKEIRGLTKKIMKKLQSELTETLTRNEYETIIKEIIRTGWDSLSDEEKEILEIEVYNYGIDDLKNGNPEKSIDHFQKLKDRNCPFEYVDLMLALSIYLKKRSQSSMKGLKAFYRKYPNDRYININLAMAYKEQGNQLQATVHLIKAAAIFESLDGLLNPTQIFKKGQRLFESGDKEKALIFLTAAYRELKTNRILYSIGQLQLKLNQFENALHSFEELTFRFPDFSRKLDEEMRELNAQFFRQGEALFAKGCIEESVERYDMATRAMMTEETLKKMAVCYRRLKQREKLAGVNLELEKLYAKKVEEEENEKVQDLVFRGKEAFHQRKYQKAVEYFEEALEIKPDKGVFVFLAHIYRLLKRNHALAILVRTYKPVFSQEEDVDDFSDFD